MDPFVQHEIDHVRSAGGGPYPHNQPYGDPYQPAAQQGRQQWVGCQLVNARYPLRRAQEKGVKQRAGNGGQHEPPPQHRPSQR